jgi:hypothetical protein
VLGLKESLNFGTEEAGFIEYDIGPGTLAIGNGLTDRKPSTGGGSLGLEVEGYDTAVAKLQGGRLCVPFGTDRDADMSHGLRL